MGGNKNGRNKSSKKQTDKDIVQSTSAGKVPSQLQASVNQDTSVGQKLDALLAIVQDMGEKLKEQDDRLLKREEKASIHDISVVPSAHSSPKQTKREATQQPGNSKPAKLPSFEVLKTDSRMQAEVTKRLLDYQDASRIEGKPTSSLKSGRFRAGIAKGRTHVYWPQNLCTVQPGSKQPTNDDLTNEQWVQGILMCILEELEVSKR